MFSVKGIILNNVVVFDKAHIPFKGKGLVVISGLNKDCLESDDQTNAVGKSLCLSTIPNVFFYSSPLATKKNSKKDMLQSKDSCITIYGSSEGKNYKIEQKQKGTSIYERDGTEWVDQGYRTDKIQREALERIFLLSQEEFYSYVYIQNQRSLEFQVGSPTTRLKFITKSFTQLGVYDQLHTYFSRQLSKLKKDEGKYDVLLNQYQDTVSRRKKLELPDDAKTLYRQYAQDLDDLTAELDTILEKEGKINSLHKIRKRYLRQKSELTKLLKELNIKHTALQTTYNKYKADLKSARNLERYIEAKESRDQTVKSIKQKISDIGVPANSKEVIAKKGTSLRKRQKDITAQLETLEEAKDYYDEAIAEYSKLESKILELDLPENFSDTSMSELDERAGQLKSNIALESLLHEHEDGQCPTCLQPVNIKRIRQLVKQAKSDLVELKNLRHGLELQDKLSKIKVPKKVTTAQLKSLNAKAEAIDSKLEDLAEEYKKHTKLSNLKEALSDIPEVKKPKLTFNYDLKDSVEIEEVLERISQAHTLYENIKEIKDEYPSVSSTEDESDVLEALAEKKVRLRKKQRALNESHQKLGTALSNHKLLTSQYRELSTELKKIKPFIDKRKLYEELVAAYSNKGLKLKATDTVLKLLEDKMNEYSHIIFSEAVSFKLSTVKLGVACEIKHGNDPGYDVSFLSGAETNCFRLLFMISMLSLVPEERRTNFVVLDEADSAMSDASREKYVTQFIPALQEVVDKVFVVTPKLTEDYINAELWKVVKDNGVSRIFRDDKLLRLN